MGRRDHERIEQEPTGAADKVAEVLARLYRAADRWPRVNPQELRHLERLVARLPPDDRSHVLLRAFVAPPANAYLAQQYAGELLKRLRPPCSGPLTDLLRSVLPKWNRSVEQLPWYLADVFGSKAIVKSLDEIDRCDMVDRVQTATVRYWLKGLDHGARRG
ncbi:hypothetical protein [Sorangium sp. So ce124]|uniref:hypothetical protein n=1 Tax=Sorangium sp. So ce124 TaxID=3133280 RepID=UPI003F5D8B55